MGSPERNADDTSSEEETVRRREAISKRVLNTPPQQDRNEPEAKGRNGEARPPRAGR